MVDHNVLLHKLGLHHFSTSALHLMKSYIYYRSQLVKIGDVHSDLLKSKSGVLQGSSTFSNIHKWYVILHSKCIKHWLICWLFHCSRIRIWCETKWVKFTKHHRQLNIQVYNKQNVHKPVKNKMHAYRSMQRLKHSPRLTLNVEN